jgi:hypothetical protein
LGAMTATVLTDGYRTRPEPLKVIIRVAKCPNALRLMTCRRLHLQNILLEQLAQNLEHIAAELRQFIQANRAHRDERAAVTGESGDP